jgi:hypothetical protein
MHQPFLVKAKVEYINMNEKGTRTVDVLLYSNQFPPMPLAGFIPLGHPLIQHKQQLLVIVPLGLLRAISNGWGNCRLINALFLSRKIDAETA